MNKELEKLCTQGDEQKIEEFEAILMASEYKHLTTYTLYRCLRKALSALNKPWIEFFIIKCRIDLSQSVFRYIVH